MVTLIVLAACSTTQDTLTSPRNGEGVVFAKGGPGVSVTSATPGWGEQGEVGKKVTIAGSGFTAGSVVAWERNGIPDPKIQVVSAVVVSSSRIETTINIAIDAELDLYDISVMTAGGKGIGTESFEVTTAEILVATSNSQAQAVNDVGDVAGYHYVPISNGKSQQQGFYYEAATGSVQNLGGGPGGCLAQATGISQSSLVIVGLGAAPVRENCSWAVVWTRGSTSSPWGASIRLPTAGGTSSSADGVAHVAARGAVVAVGSVGSASGPAPTYWLLPDGSSTWTGPHSVTTPGVGGRIRAVTPQGVFGGNVNYADDTRLAAVWEPDGTLTVLQPAAGTTANCFVHALSPNGQYAVGECSGEHTVVAVYWTRAEDGTWNAGQTFAPQQYRAWGVNDAGIAVGAAYAWQIGGSGAITLPGLGDGGRGGVARAISNVFPAVLVGVANSKGGAEKRAVRWQQYWSFTQ